MKCLLSSQEYSKIIVSCGFTLDAIEKKFAAPPNYPPSKKGPPKLKGMKKREE